MIRRLLILAAALAVTAAGVLAATAVIMAVAGYDPNADKALRVWRDAGVPAGVTPGPAAPALPSGRPDPPAFLTSGTPEIRTS